MMPENKKSRKPRKIKAFGVVCGVPARIRTGGVPLRRRTLYPAEVQRHLAICGYFYSTHLPPFCERREVEQTLRRRMLYPAELRRQLHPAILHAGREKVNGRLPPFIRLPSRCKCIPAFCSHRKEVCEPYEVIGCTKKERLQNADALSMGLIAAPCRRGSPPPWVPGTSWK